MEITYTVRNSAYRRKYTGQHFKKYRTFTGQIINNW